MKKLSKKLSLIVCIAMIANLFVFAAPSVLASDSGAEVLYKSSFSDYTSNGSPKGWVKTKYILQNNEEVENTTSAISALSQDGNNNFIQFKDDVNEVRDVIPFGKMISDGKIHISYDAKVPESEKNTASNGASSVAVLFNARYNSGYYNNANGGVKVSPFNDYDPYNPEDLRGGNGRQLSHLFKVLYKDHKKYVSNAGGEKWGLGQSVGTNPVQNNVWYHTDIIVDVDNGVYDAWVDGEKLTTQSIALNTDDGATVFKGFSFLQQDGNKIGHYDNVVITHYKTNDTIQMVADAGKNGIGADASDGKYLNVSFNDTLKESLRANDFKITAADGSEVTGVVISQNNKTGSGCVLDFNAAVGLKGNTDYTVTYNANNNGVATEVDAYGASATFRTNAEVVDTSAAGYKYYYEKEDFDGYTSSEQLPFGFYNSSNFNNSKDGNIYNKYLSKEAITAYGAYASVAGKDGKALKLKNSSSIYNFFPRGVVAGDFTMEFDVKYKVGGWSVGLIPYRSWENARVQNKINSDGVVVNLNNNRYINALIGMSTGATNSAISAPNLAICKTEVSGGVQHCQPTMNESYDVSTGLQVKADEWAHIKLDFDMAEGNVDIYVSDAQGNEEKALDQSYGDWNKFGSGVEGIVFYKGKSADTSAELNIDNLSVYSTSNKLMNQDFNGYKSGSATRFPYFWISDSLLKDQNSQSDSRDVSSVKLTADTNAYSVSGKTGSADDQAMKLTGTKANDAGTTGQPLWYTARFEKTVPAGQSYAVEFDLKYDDDQTVWVFGPVDSTRVTALVGYNNDYTNAADNMVNTNLLGMANKTLYYYKHYKQAAIDANINLLNDNSTYYSKLSDDAVEAGVWKHYKIVAVPQATNTKYIVTVDGKEYSFNDNLNNNTKDIAGIAFQIKNATNFKSDWGITLDNVNAYLCDSTGAEITKAKDNSILNIEAEKLNGDTVSLTYTDKIPYSTKKITVTFSENLKETLNKDLSPVSISNGTRTGTVKGIYDCIEDVIQLRSKNAAYPMDYDSQIDGNKFIITLKDALSDETTYSLHIAKNVGFESSPYSTLNKGFSRTYTGAADTDGGFKLTKCEAGITDGSTWKAVTAYSDITGNEGKLGLKFNLTNLTGVDKNIRAIAAFYDESGAVSKLVNVSFADYIFETNGSAYEQIVPISVPTLAEGESYTTVRFFAWDADSQAPLKNPQEFSNK